jgi:hypothetical protein
MDPMIMGIRGSSSSGMVIAEDFIGVICTFGLIVDINQFFVFQIMFI